MDHVLTVLTVFTTLPRKLREWLTHIHTVNPIIWLDTQPDDFHNPINPLTSLADTDDMINITASVDEIRDFDLPEPLMYGSDDQENEGYGDWSRYRDRWRGLLP